MEKYGHGWARMAGGEVAALFTATDPSVACGSLVILVRAASRSEAVATGKQLGLHGIHLRTNPHPPASKDVAVLEAADDSVLWRRFDSDG
ncbi:MAG TPA: hypothetical protein VFK66_04800, partial [Oryzihumus sp.]|nr:hypothetical protein [Oryzihumus sp.]